MPSRSWICRPCPPKSRTRGSPRSSAAPPYPEVNPGEPAKVTIGGFNIGVAKTTQYEDLAWEAVECLTNEENQRNNAVNGGVPPVLARLYDDPEFQAVYPAWEGVLGSIESAAVRPVSPAYQSISILLTDALNPPQNIDPVADVDKLADLVTKAVNSEVDSMSATTESQPASQPLDKQAALKNVSDGKKAERRLG